MNKNHLRNSMLMSISGLVLMTTAQADGRHPLWTFEQVTGYPPSVTVSSAGTATIKYTVTNRSHKSHTLTMHSYKGIEPSGCTSSLEYRQSCILSLSITGSALIGDVLGGPVLCEQSNKLQCYQPSQENSLAIRLTPTPPIPQYTITPSAGVNGLISPSTAQVVNSGSTITFTATPDAGYGVNQWLVDGNLAQTGGTTYQLTNITANHAVNVTFGTATLISSVSTLALSINCNTAACTALEIASLTGNPRLITIQNTGSVSATNVSVSASGLPAGTSITNNTCSGTLNAGNSCTITLTPSNVASSDASGNACTLGTQPVAGAVTVAADAGLSNQVDVYVLGYGCQYQGGFIYSVDDTTPNTGSIGGKVAATTDQTTTAGIVWDSNSGCINYPYSGCYITNAGSGTNGTNLPTPSPGGNTYLIYQTITTTNSELPAFYAAGLCANYTIDSLGNTPCVTGTCYNDWYLPADCEMGYGANSQGINCGTQTSPALQNMQSNLVENGDLAGLATGGTPTYPGVYWSSTESSSFPNYDAWLYSFFVSGGGLTNTDYKGENALGVRCSRAFLGLIP